MNLETQLNHPILEQSFAIIDREIGPHHLNPLEYTIARRIIHATADFEFAHLLHCSVGAIEAGIEGIANGCPIITDVTMVKQGIKTLVEKTFQNPLIAAVEHASIPAPGKTRTETGILHCFERYPHGIYAIGNAPTALLAICQGISQASFRPKLTIAVPVGFVSVVESKQALARLDVPQIRVEGRKGGSSVAAAIVNALIVLAWERR